MESDQLHLMDLDNNDSAVVVIPVNQLGPHWPLTVVGLIVMGLLACTLIQLIQDKVGRRKKKMNMQPSALIIPMPVSNSPGYVSCALEAMEEDVIYKSP